MNLNNLEKKVVDSLPMSEKEKNLLMRRVNKLKRDPKLFIEDSYKKRSKQLSRYIGKKEPAKEQYTIITAVYNSESYLDDFFKSLVRQTISFKSHIQVIVVDDGSNDRSAEVILQWQKRYPKNIHYYYKGNGGAASARNLGLQYAKTEWITFIDPDDFIATDYFYHIDRALDDYKNLDLAVAKIFKYDQDATAYNDSYPLKKVFSFKGSTKIIETEKQGDKILTSICGLFFRKSLLDSNKLFFNEKLSVVFEDTNFVNKYLIFNRNGKIAFVKGAQYYHRSNDEHPVDSVWNNEGIFGTSISESLLELCKLSSRNLDYVPVSIQTTVLYHVAWMVSKLIDNDLAVDFLTEDQKEYFLCVLDELFEYIDEEVILKYGYSKALFSNKIGFLNVFKKKSIEAGSQRAYIDSYNHNRQLVRVRYFSNKKDDLLSFTFDGKETIVDYKKVIQHNLFSRVFSYEYVLWLKISENNDILNFFINGEQAILHLGSKRFKNLGKAKIFQHFNDSGNVLPQYEQLWFFIDSDLKADDNAEHLYRYILNNTDMPKENLVFGLNATSHDWSRLRDEGFNLVDMQSQDALIAMRSSDKIISSNASDYIMSFDGKNSLLNKNFIFLQHGVIHNDLSRWLKAKDFDIFVTSTVDEYKSILDERYNYFFTEREVKLTGQPRYDSLLAGNNTRKEILIMPTWRKDIVGKLISGTTAEREFNAEFMQTEYAQKWQSFLNNDLLKTLSTEYGYKVTYFPHANVQIYSHLFNIPEYIQVVTHDTGSIQSLFQSAKIMITDYSSVAFEMAYLNKQVIYYQFDEEKFLSGGHTSRPSYFKYRDHGFGPVVTDEDDLITELRRVLDNDGSPLEPYNTRMKETFAYRDTNNCQRVYSEIVALDKPHQDDLNMNILEEFSRNAYDKKDWSLAESRSRLLLQSEDESQQVLANEILISALFNRNKYSEVIEAINHTDILSEERVIYWQAKIAYAVANWRKAITLLEPLNSEDKDVQNIYLNSYSQVGDVNNFIKTKNSLMQECTGVAQTAVMNALEFQARRNWRELVENLEQDLPFFSTNELSSYTPELLLAKSYRMLGDYEKAHRYLVNFERHSKGDPRSRISIARLAFARQDYKKCLSQYQLGSGGDIRLLASDYAAEYVESLIYENKLSEALEVINIYIDIYRYEPKLQKLYALIMIENEKWKEVVQFIEANNLTSLSDRNIQYVYSKALYRMGYIQEAYNHVDKPSNEDSYEYWQFVSEVATLKEDYELAKYCYRGMISIYPDRNKKENWDSYHRLIS